MFAPLRQWWWLLLIFFVLVIIAIVWRWYRTPAKKESDIERATLDSDLHWDTPDESLKKVYEYVIGVSDSTIEWYQTRRRPKRQLGFFIRLGALLLTVGAGLVPLSPIPPVWSTVMLAVAGLLISIDVLAGHTSGWIRYMLAQ